MKKSGRQRKGLTIRAYAAHRRGLGLPGNSNWSVQKALRDGRIRRNEDGRIDPEEADRLWLQNTCHHRPLMSP